MQGFSGRGASAHGGQAARLRHSAGNGEMGSSLVVKMRQENSSPRGGLFSCLNILIFNNRYN